MGNSSIGIIGGADGPTAILITGHPFRDLMLAAAAVILITLAVVWLVKRKK